tara:strand:- start:91 stop:540 length:450 start_codon:yes stop_codon:yes gene_type:complete
MAKINIFYGSVYGGAERLADSAEEQLQKHGHEATVIDNPQVEDVSNSEYILVITSTTGQGEIPDNLMPLFAALQSQFPLLGGTPFAVIAMGDSSYGDTFCGAGKQVEELLMELQGKPLLPRLDIDALEDFAPEPVAQPWLAQFAGAITE